MDSCRGIQSQCTRVREQGRKEVRESGENSGEQSSQERKGDGVTGAQELYREVGQPPLGVGAQAVSWPRSRSLQPTPMQVRNPQQVSRPMPLVGPCFGCGERGHLRRYCPKTVPGQARWYPCTDFVRCMD